MTGDRPGQCEEESGVRSGHSRTSTTVTTHGRLSRARHVASEEITSRAWSREASGTLSREETLIMQQEVEQMTLSRAEAPAMFTNIGVRHRPYSVGFRVYGVGCRETLQSAHQTVL